MGFLFYFFFGKLTKIKKSSSKYGISVEQAFMQTPTKIYKNIIGL
jgi:hypothetical protein